MISKRLGLPARFARFLLIALILGAVASLLLLSTSQPARGDPETDATPTPTAIVRDFKLNKSLDAPDPIIDPATLTEHAPACETCGYPTIWVDRGTGSTYYIGEQARVCYTVPRADYMRILNFGPNGTQVILQGRDDGRGGCFYATLGAPPGMRRLRIEMLYNGSPTGEYGETYFYVVGGPVRVDITVDRENGSYMVGETIRLRYTVSRPVWVRLYDCPPGQGCHGILEGNDDGRGGAMTATASAPLGWEKVRIEAVENGQVLASDEAWFYITRPVNTEPPAGMCRVTWIGTNTSCSGEFGLASPQRRAIFSNYQSAPSQRAKDIGPYDPGTSLTFYIRPTGYCANNEYLSTSANARIQQLGTNNWRINWEDLPPNATDSDYNDLIVDVQCGLPVPQPDPKVSRSLTFSPNPANVNDQVTGSFSIHNYGNATWNASQVCIAGVPNGGGPPCDPNVSIAPGQTLDFQQRQSFSSPGTYNFEVNWQDSAQNWHRVDADSGVSRTGTVTVQDNRPPAAISDLASPPGAHNGDVDLRWTAPGSNGTGGSAASMYDIRYSASPINTSNWDSATRVSGEPTPASPGTQQHMTVSGLATGARWYFAMTTSNTAGNWSGLSNVPSLQDLGFRPQPDGYKFANYGNSYPFGNFDLNASQITKLFGEEQACLVRWPVCIVKTTYAAWAMAQEYKMNAGHCLGMASTSLRFFENLDQESQFQTGVSSTHMLDKDKIREHIALYHVMQYTTPVESDLEQATNNDPRTVLSQLQTAMPGSPANPPVLIMRQGPKLGHAVTPYAIQELGGNKWWVWLYDNNYQDDSNRHAAIDGGANSWSYDLGGSVGTWSGTGNTHNFGIARISEFAQSVHCPSCIGPLSITSPLALSSTVSQVVLTGPGSLLITDATGRRLGNVGNEFVNEIPEAHSYTDYSGLGVEMEPTYSLPSSFQYTIQVSAPTVVSTQAVTVTQFGPGYAASIGNLRAQSGSAGVLTASPDGSQVAFQATSSVAPTLSLARDRTNESNEFRVTDGPISAGQTVKLTDNVNDGRVAFDNSHGSSSLYQLEITQVNSGGQRRFSHTNIPVPAGDTHYVNYGAWNGAAMTIQIDHGSDGTIDQTIQMGNQLLSCPGDANGDGVVNAADFSILMSEWQHTCSSGSCRADFNNDNVVNAADYSILMANWQHRCTP